MGNTRKNDNEHWVTSIKRVLVEIRKFARALKTPVDPSEYIWEYGKITLNTGTGLFNYGDLKIQLRQNDRIYKIIRLLVGAMGKEVSYIEMAKELDLSYQSRKEQRQSRLSIRASIRDLRRRLKINANTEKDKNPFITTGKGIKLAYHKK